MKISRLKKVQKNLGFYVNNYKFREPYQVLIDGTFSFAALENKFSIQEQLPKYFQAETKLLTTQCVILETEKLGPKVYGAMLIVKQFAIHRCGHEKNPTSGSKCLLSMIGKDNSSRYLIATQDRELQDRIRSIPGVPLLYLHGRAPTLDPPSQASRRQAGELLKDICMNATQEETIKSLKQISGLAIEAEPKTMKKRKKGGPNPLSVKKKKKKNNNNMPERSVTQNTKTPGKVRKRKKVKLPGHVKEALKISLKK